MKNTLLILFPLFYLFLQSSNLHALNFDVELVCKKTTLFVDRGTVLAGFNKFKSEEMIKEDGVYQLYKQYCFVDEENMTYTCDEYARLDKDSIWTKGGFKLDRKTLKGSLRGLGGGLECKNYSRGSTEFRDELRSKITKFNDSVKENQI